MYRFLSSHRVRVAVCMAALIVGVSLLRIPWTATAHAQDVSLPAIQSSSGATDSSDTDLPATTFMDADADGVADDLLGAPPSISGSMPYGPAGGDSTTSYVDIAIVNAGYPSYPYNRLTALGYTVEMIPPDATLETMNAYDIVYLPASWARDADPSFDVIEANAARYQTYAAEGGGLLIEQPNPFDRPGGIVTPALLPFPVTFYAFYDARDNPPIVVDPGHYLTQDLAPLDLPFPADLMQNVDPHYKVLVVGNTTGSPSLAVTDYGAGRILIHTAHANPSSTFPFSDWTYIRMIEWLANKERPLSPISGRVADQDDVGVGSVKIHAYGPEYTINATTNFAGEFEMRGVPPGQYTIVAEAAPGDGVWPEAIQVVVPPYAEDVDFIYTKGAPPQPPAVKTSVSGIVRAEGTNARVAGATVTLGGLRVKTNGSGAYSFAAVSPGIHQIRIRRDGYLYYRDFVTVGARGVPVTHNATLAYIEPDGYRLPYHGGEVHAVLRGYGSGSHDGNANYALDFDLYSDAVVAAADGVVKAVRDDSSESCWPDDACRNDANYVLMRHKDLNGRLFDTVYWHLEPGSVTVAEGDALQRGDPVATSGSTGWSFGPQLHFHAGLAGGSLWDAIGLAFDDEDLSSDGGIPQEGEWYTSGNAPAASDSSSEVVDGEPPQGSVLLQVTGQPKRIVHLNAADYQSGVESMRLSPSLFDVGNAKWVPYAETAEWSHNAVFVQYRDSVGNVSTVVVSDTVDAVAYTTIHAGFAVSPTVCTGEQLSIVNETYPYCEQCSWQWDFGNGDWSHQAEPAYDHSGTESTFRGYAVPGVYTVDLAVTNVFRTSTASGQVEAIPAPLADFDATVQALTVTVEALEQDATAWLWDFGDGTSATGRTATHAYDADWVQDRHPTVRLTVTKSNGCTTSSLQYVAVEEDDGGGDDGGGGGDDGGGGGDDGGGGGDDGGGGGDDGGGGGDDGGGGGDDGDGDVYLPTLQR